MSDLPQQNTIVQYVADGMATVYIVPFYTPLETTGQPDLNVYTQAQNATPIPASDINEWNVAYTYTPNLDPITGGVITFNMGFIPATGYIVTIERDVSASLDVEFSNAQNFSGFTLDAALDKLLLISQQNKTYALERNLSYIVNTYLPDAIIEANTQIPVLEDGQTWFGSANGVIAATLQQPADVSTLRSELANNQPTTNGAALVGYYDPLNLNPTTVAAQLTLLTEGTDSPFPTGSLIDFAGTSAPTGFLICDGSAISRMTYANLFAVIGTIWGIGDGSSTFNIPNLSRSVTMGSGGVGTSIIGNAVGNTCIGETTTLTDPLQIPSHNHVANSVSSLTTQFDINTGFTATIPIFSSNVQGSATLPVSTTTTIQNTGGSMPFNIIQTAAIVLKCIKI